MNTPKALTPDELNQALGSLPGWEVAAGKLHREFTFANFREAFGFMSQMALYSERKDHHPEWFNVYKSVVIDLQTHAAGAISELDVAWAKTANAISSKLLA